uniref:Uncharacterized protein n=1 Tax=Pararge aegeria TaxID=116150 RepID=S4PMH1_9NEOP
MVVTPLVKPYTGNSSVEALKLSSHYFCFWRVLSGDKCPHTYRDMLRSIVSNGLQYILLLPLTIYLIEGNKIIEDLNHGYVPTHLDSRKNKSTAL